MNDRPDAMPPVGEVGPVEPLNPSGAATAIDPSRLAQPDANLVLRILYDEQVRLRNEVDELRKKADEQKDQGKDDKQGGDKEGQDKEGKDKGGQDKQGGDKQEGGDDKEGEDKKEEKKPPVKDRVGGWIKQHPIATILIIVGIILLIILGWLLWRYLDSYENTDDAFVDGHTDPISPRINGIVVATYVENTYRVKKGQLLVDLDPRDYEVSLLQARANLTQAQASVREQEPNVPITETNQSTQVVNADLSVVNAEANVDSAEEKHRSALSDLEQAEANQANAQREEERYRALVEKEEVSRELYDQRATAAWAQTAMVASRRQTAEAAAKAVTQAEAQLDQARQQAEQAARNKPRQEAVQAQTLAQRKANADAAEAQLNQAALNLQYTHIYAPEDGVIGDKSVQVGMQVAAGTELLALTQTNDIWVTANFKETQVARMRAGLSVTIHVDALSMNFDGYVEALPGASGAVYSLLPPENATGNYVKVVQRLPVRIRIKPNQNGLERLAPGMSVEPKVWLQ